MRIVSGLAVWSDIGATPRVGVANTAGSTPTGAAALGWSVEGSVDGLACTADCAGPVVATTVVFVAAAPATSLPAALAACGTSMLAGSILK